MHKWVHNGYVLGCRGECMFKLRNWYLHCLIRLTRLHQLLCRTLPRQRRPNELHKLRVWQVLGTGRDGMFKLRCGNIWRELRRIGLCELLCGVIFRVHRRNQLHELPNGSISSFHRRDELYKLPGGYLSRFNRIDLGCKLSCMYGGELL
jgi:hypothetical protein